MSNLNKSKKDKEILAEYESQVKGKMTAFILLNDTVTPIFSYLCTRMYHTHTPVWQHVLHTHWTKGVSQH